MNFNQEMWQCSIFGDFLHTVYNMEPPSDPPSGNRRRTLLQGSAVDSFVRYHSLYTTVRNQVPGRSKINNIVAKFKLKIIPPFHRFTITGLPRT